MLASSNGEYNFKSNLPNLSFEPLDKLQGYAEKVFPDYDLNSLNPRVISLNLALFENYLKLWNVLVKIYKSNNQP